MLNFSKVQLWEAGSWW